MKRILLIGAFIVWHCCANASAQTLPSNVSYNGRSLTPAMGWNSWNHFGCSGLNETVIEQQASAMATSGMKAARYAYINLDDCWMAANRDANGNLVPDPTNFPSGMPVLVSYVHNLGLKIGLYEDVGTATCSGRPGSYGHYQQDADTFAAWGIDYIKMDWCNDASMDPKTQYTQFSQALTAANANVVFSICDWGTNMPWEWAPAIGNSWRTTPDISDNWLSMINNLEATSALAPAARAGAWNDPDMLEVGNGGMTDTEYQTHFVMWAMLAAPLISGNDLTKMSVATLATLTNSEVIAVDQDPAGTQGVLLSDNGSGLQVWSRQVVGGTVVALLNKSASTAAITVKFSDLGLDPSLPVTVRDLWNHVDLGPYTNSISSMVPSHGVTLLKMGATATAPAQTVLEADASANTLSGTAVIQQCPGAWGYSCLDGQDVGYIGNGTANTIIINDINAASSGAYNLILYAAVNGTRTYNVSVNGGAVSAVNMTGTSFSIPSVSGMTVQLNAGYNTIQLSNPSAYAPDLDHIVYSSQGSVTPGFNIAYPTPNVTIASPGQSGIASITLVPTGGLTGNVAISCALPAGMTGATCAPTTASLSGPANAVASLTITTTAPSSASLRPESPSSQAVAIVSKSVDSRSLKAKSQGTGGLYAILLPIPGLALIGFGLGRKGPWRNTLPTLLLLGIISTSLIQIAACGSSVAGNSGGGSCSAVPSAPTGLSASSTTSAGTTLTWTATSASAICAVTGYSVYQNGTLIASPAGATYSVTGLSPSTTYNFTVAANDSYGASASTPALGVTTTAAVSGTATPAGTYQVAVTATSGGTTQDASFQIIVQ